MYDHAKKVCLEQNISIGSNLFLYTKETPK